VGVSVLAALGLAVLSFVALWQWQIAVDALNSKEVALEEKNIALEGEREERRQRALAQVETLLRADARAVPTILDNLAEHRDEVLPRLRRVWEGPDTLRNRPRRMRAALALLPVEPQRVRDSLVKWMLQVPDPAELLVVRDSLRPHAATLRDNLWRRLEQRGNKAEQRLRILAALAAFDPQGARWKTAGEQALGPWLSDNPLYLGTWTEALRPARDALLGPLTEVFKGKHLAERRPVAASILADYAKDQSATLAELIVQADDRQFATLFPVLRRHREAVLPLLTREVQRVAAPPWNDPPLPKTWPTIAPAVQKQIEEASGLLAERFAFVQTLPLDRFASLAEVLRRSGYRPVRLRPYRAGKMMMQVAAVWTRDGRDWRLLQDISAEKVRHQDAELRKAGFQGVDVCGWLQPAEAPTEVYAALWVRAAADKQEARLYVGVHEARHAQDGWQPLKQAGLEPLTMHAFRGTDGTRRFSSAWRRLVPWPQVVAHFVASKRFYESQLTPDQVQMDVGLSCEGPAPEYRGVWHKVADSESVEQHGLTPAAHRERCRELMQQSYRCVALSVAETAPGTLVTASVWQRPRVTDQARETLARRQSGAGLTLLRLGQPEGVWPLLAHSAYPEARTRLIHRMGPEGVPSETLIARLHTEKDNSIRRALILALGEYTDQDLPAKVQKPLVKQLLDWYRNDPDSGVHGAIDWLLRHGKEGPTDRLLDWGQASALRKIDEELAVRLRAERFAAIAGTVVAATPAPGAWPLLLLLAGVWNLEARARDTANWFVNSQGQTLAVIDSRKPFLMGAPDDEAGRHSNETLHWSQIGRRYAIATKAVTVAQWKRFLAAHPEVKHNYPERYSPEAEGPIITVTWYEAAQYCRWLSELESVPEHEMVFPSVAEIEKYKNGAGPLLRLPADHLKRKGYRLPTEAEWEYAARAGTKTSRYYGSSLELLPRYAWSPNNAKERTRPVGQLKPNDFGLFDMHGNVWTWCLDTSSSYPGGTRDRPVLDKEDLRPVTDRLSRVMRGASFSVHPGFVRSAFRNSGPPSFLNNTVGVRVARTWAELP
jgi:formylglycine-generating enzyme required for sulfatase activity